jgi:hypothetical protein
MMSFRLRIMAQVLPFLLMTPGLALAQAPPNRAEAAAALNPASTPAAAQYNRQQIDQMVAPIALYPDELLSQVLMAATYPPQIVDAAQWLQDPGNAALKGDALVAALQPLPWDPSVKALVAFPQIVAMLSEHIEWTQTLGVAFATQQAEVMTRVQTLRHLAVKSGRLNKLRQLAVRQDGPVIVIAEADPGRIFVPVYNPMVMYGEWQDRDYPPVFLPPPSRFAMETIEPGIEVGIGYGIVAPLWGWSRPDWRGQRIAINRAEYARIAPNVPLAPGDGWRRNGPVVLAAPAAAARPAAAVSAPAGTVAPSAAAAVVALPQRAASQPALIQTQKTAAQPAATQPGQAQTTPAKPATVQPGQAQTAPAKPATAQPGQAQTTPAKPTTAQPEQAQTTPAHPDAAQAEEKKAATTPTGAAQSGQTQATTTPPGKVQGTATAPAAHQPAEHAPAASAAKPAGPAAKSAPEQAGVKAPAGVPEQTPRPPEQAGARPPAGPQGAPVRVPEQAAVKPPAGVPTPGVAAPPGNTAQRPAPEAVGHGSSTPPAAIAAPPGSQSAQRPHEPAKARPPGSPEEGDKKER